MRAGGLPQGEVLFSGKVFFPLFFFVLYMVFGSLAHASGGDTFSAVKSRAEKGEVAAQLELALRYAEGDGVSMDYKKGFYWLKKSADNGYAVAQFNLGLIYEQGMYEVPQDLEKAVFWYRKAADQGDVEALFSLGAFYLKHDRNTGKATVPMAKAAEQGHAGAQYFLGMLYERGDGVEPDREIAIALYQDAARQGLAAARERLAALGVGNPAFSADYDKSSFAAVLAAAEGGNPAAQLQMANMLLDGDGIEPDKDKAVKWVNQSVAQGYAPAMHVLSMMYMTGEGVAKDEEEALKWMRKAADAGSDAAQFNQGLYFQNLSGDRASYMRARFWYTKSAEQGNPAAQVNLGRMYEQGMGVPADMGLAAKWYLAAARQGFPLGQHNIAWMYANGLGVPQDIEKADYWYFAFLANGEAVVNPILEAVAKSEGEGDGPIPAWLEFVLRNGDVIGSVIRDWGEMRYGRY
ncbi:sel1 repeat family protein [Oxalobacter vibrioformis]|uniref:Sel1 repeat family protein n=1 Tax=Oxalobacter vibrioformis TaxID=933080 RepID=A0A9E9LUH6_9BURK|nr:tetratricopeptide repeat protein [Oxalobacter vibrioformis]WAW09860.1 sel1 repeat family protein [Oxalobacter vibrioformis]